MKKPGVAAKPGAPISIEACPGKRAYIIMWYKANESFGIRAHHGSQVMTVRKKGVAKATLEAIAKGACDRLCMVCSVDTAKAWAAGELSSL